MTGLLITSWLSFLNTPTLTVVGDMDKITLSTYWMDSGQLQPHLGRGEGLAFVSLYWELTPARPLGFTFSKDALSGHQCCIRCHPKPHPSPILYLSYPGTASFARTGRKTCLHLWWSTQRSHSTLLYEWMNEWTKQWKINKNQKPFPQFCHCLTFKLI